MRLVVRPCRGKFEVSLEYKDELTGKRRWKRKAIFETKEHAEAFKEELSFGEQMVVLKCLTLGESILSELKDDHERGFKKSQSTQNSYLMAYENHIKKELGDILVNKLTPQMIQEFVDSKAKIYSYSTVNLILTVVKKGITRCERLGMVDKNLMSSVKIWGRESGKNSSKNFLEINDLSIIINSVEDVEFRLQILLSATLGIRESEVLGLSWKAIDFNKNEITIRSIVTRSSEGKVVLQNYPKNKREYVVLMPNVLKNELIKYREQWENKLDKCGDLLFARKFEPISVQLLSQKFKTHVNKLGYKDLTFHGLRHSYATMLYDSGYSIDDIAYALNHKNKNTTSQVYIHLTESNRNKTKDIIDNIFI